MLTVSPPAAKSCAEAFFNISSSSVLPARPFSMLQDVNDDLSFPAAWNDRRRLISEGATSNYLSTNHLIFYEGIRPIVEVENSAFPCIRYLFEAHSRKPARQILHFTVRYINRIIIHRSRDQKYVQNGRLSTIHVPDMYAGKTISSITSSASSTRGSMPSGSMV